MFCPECGKPLVAKAKQTDETVPQSRVPPQSAAGTYSAPVSSGEPAAAKEPRHGIRKRTRETLHTASNAARGAIGENVKRVEKIHHVSTVMLEATYDPSLRFVLVALGLFVAFIILLVLSKIMG